MNLELKLDQWENYILVGLYSVLNAPVFDMMNGESIFYHQR